MHLPFWNPSTLRRRLHAWVRGLDQDTSMASTRPLLSMPAHEFATISIADHALFSGAKPRIAAQPRPVRVVRVLEADQPRSGTGRMVISGRMADVCAELDRLAAYEALAH